VELNNPSFTNIHPGARKFMATPALSLITCTLGRRDKLLRLLQSLRLQDPDLFELILVDQNPPGFLEDALEPFKSQFSITHLHTAKGLSLGRNLGLQRAQGVLVAFPDDDCWYRPHTLFQVISLFQAHADLDFITGRTCDASNMPSLSPTLENAAIIDRDNYLVCGNSNSIFARMKALRRIGGFDERLGVGAATPFQSGEESDLVLSAMAAQMKLAYFPALVIHHDQVDNANATAYVDRARKYGAGYGAILRKHRFGFVYLCFRVLRSMARSLLHAARLQWTEAHYKRSWALGIWSGYWQWPRQLEVAAWPAK
jgi:glycosyltransferase involved in cell wall biosynthesis